MCIKIIKDRQDLVLRTFPHPLLCRAKVARIDVILHQWLQDILAHPRSH